MTKAYQLPEDIGHKSVTRNGKEVQAASEFPAGQTTASKSVPTVLPREDYTFPIIDNSGTPRRSIATFWVFRVSLLHIISSLVTTPTS